MLKQWVIAGLAVIGGFFFAGLAGSIAAEVLGYWHIPPAGFFAALAVVLTTYLAAPSHNWPLACLAFFAGALVAWRFLEPSWLPDTTRYGSHAYQPTHLPIIATYLGGVVGLTLVGIHSLRPSPNNSSKPTPLRGAA